MHDTVFSSKAFVDAWCLHFGGNLRPLRIRAEGGSQRDGAYAVAMLGRTGLSSVGFAPEGFYGSPGWSEECRDVVDDVLSHLQSRSIRKFIWNVRFDHQPLAAELESRLREVQRFTTQVLPLGADHDHTFGNFNATIRNQIRRAKKTGVVVREGNSEQDLADYYRIHEQHIARKGGFEFVYPRPFLLALIQPAVGGRLFLATVEEKIVAGGIFLPDGDSVYYFHGAYDDAYSKQYPTCAVIDEAIRWSQMLGVHTFNFGGSGELDSLKRFKSFWGTETVDTWRFTWRNPLWNTLDGATQWLKRLAHSR